MPHINTEWKIEHIRIGRNPGGNQRWGTDVTRDDGRVVKFTGKLTRDRAIELAARYISDEDILAAHDAYIALARHSEASIRGSEPL